MSKRAAPAPSAPTEAAVGAVAAEAAITAVGAGPKAIGRPAEGRRPRNGSYCIAPGRSRRCSTQVIEVLPDPGQLAWPVKEFGGLIGARPSAPLSAVYRVPAATPPRRHAATPPRRHAACGGVAAGTRYTAKRQRFGGVVFSLPNLRSCRARGRVSADSAETCRTTRGKPRTWQAKH